MNETDLQAYSVAVQTANKNVADARALITQALSMVEVVDMTLLSKARLKLNDAQIQLTNLDRDMTDDFCDDNDSDVDLHSWIGSHTDARGHKHAARLGERKPLDAEDAIDSLNEVWFAMRDEILAEFDEFKSVVQAMHDKEGS